MEELITVLGRWSLHLGDNYYRGLIFKLLKKPLPFQDCTRGVIGEAKAADSHLKRNAITFDKSDNHYTSPDPFSTLLLPTTSYFILLRCLDYETSQEHSQSICKLHVLRLSSSFQLLLESNPILCWCPLCIAFGCSFSRSFLCCWLLFSSIPQSELFQSPHSVCFRI